MTAHPPPALALKEWDVVVAALEQGLQAVLVRRGGLDDPGHRFAAPHSGPFWLYPTLFHERALFLKPEHRSLLVPGAHRVPHAVAAAAGRPADHPRPASPGTVSLRAVAEVVDVVEAPSLERLRSLEERTVWTERYLTLRCRQRQLSEAASIRPVVAVLRVSVLPERVEVPDLPEYGGCRSWVELRDPPDASAARPVWGDGRLAGEVEAVRGLLGAGGGRAGRPHPAGSAPPTPTLFTPHPPPLPHPPPSSCESAGTPE